MQSDRLQFIRVAAEKAGCQICSVEHQAGCDSFLFSAARSQIYLMVLRREERIIGRVIVDDMNPRQRSAEIKIAIERTDDRGKGYGTEALNTVCHSLIDRGYTSLYLRVSSDNNLAIRCYKKAGFKRTAVLQNHRLKKHPVVLMEYCGCLP